LDVVAIQSSNWSFVDVLNVVSLFFVCFSAVGGVPVCFLLLFAVFVAVVVDAVEADVGRASSRASIRASAEVVDGIFEVFGVAVAADAEAVDGLFEIFGDVDEGFGCFVAVASFPLLKPLVGSPMNEETADLNESSFALFFPVFFGGECFLAFPFVTS